MSTTKNNIAKLKKTTNSISIPKKTGDLAVLTNENVVDYKYIIAIIIVLLLSEIYSIH